MTDPVVHPHRRGEILYPFVTTRVPSWAGHRTGVEGSLIRGQLFPPSDQLRNLDLTAIRNQIAEMSDSLNTVRTQTRELVLIMAGLTANQRTIAQQLLALRAPDAEAALANIAYGSVTPGGGVDEEDVVV